MEDFEIPDVSGYRIENWPADEREMYCGVYTSERRAELMDEKLATLRARHAHLAAQS